MGERNKDYVQKKIRQLVASDKGKWKDLEDAFTCKTDKNSLKIYLSFAFNKKLSEINAFIIIIMRQESLNNRFFGN